MNTLSVLLQGRFGNQAMQWLFCAAWAERNGYVLCTGDWVGTRVFDLPTPYPLQPGRRVNEVELAALDGTGCNESLEFRGYAQMQRCMIYTKRQAQQWLRLRPEIEREHYFCRLVAHRRCGDYSGYGYPVVSEQSYLLACEEYALASSLGFVTEENPHGKWTGELAWVPDFLIMLRAKVLLRGNSSFSWLAALLGNGLVLSPVVDGLGAGEHHCRFVPGNHPRFCNLDFVEDLYVAP